MADDIIQEVKVVYSSSSGLSNVLADLKKVEDHASQIQKSLDDAFKGGAISGSVYNSATKSLTKEIQRQTDSVLKNSDAVQKMREGINDTAAGLPRLRYALYDVSTTATIAGASLLGIATAIAGLAIKMDREFVDVIRTTGVYLDDSSVSAEQLRKSFNDLFTSIPISWGALTEIGTLAGQLGVASENVAEFTKLVAMFASVTDVSVEQSATAFGRLSELLDVPASQYENLGSSILAVGVASVATESQIINTTAQLASMGNFAGFSADEVVGLSSALASLGTQPELSRGTITRLFTNISKAIADGGDRLNEFARVSNMTASDFARDWGEDAAGTFQRFIEGLGRIDEQGGDAVITLNRLGITAARDIPTILRLAQNHKLLAEQMEIARKGYEDGTVLSEHYGLQAETVAAKLEVLRNNFQAFIAALGSSSGALGGVIDLLTGFVKALTNIAENPISSTIMGGVLAITALAGVTLLATGAMTRFGASTAALVTATVEMRKMAVAMGIVATEAQAAAMSYRELSVAILGATRSTQAFTLALRGLKIASVVGIALVAVELIYEAFNKGSEEADRFRESMTEALKSDTLSGEGLRTLTVNLNDFTDATQAVRISQEAWNRILDGSSTYVEEMARAVRDGADAVDNFNVSIGESTIREFMNAFVQDEELRKAFEDGLIPEDLDFRELAEAWATGGEDAANAYLDAVFQPEKLRAAIEEQRRIYTEAFNAVEDPYAWAYNADFDPAVENARRQAEALGALEERYGLLEQTMGILTRMNGPFADAVLDAAFKLRVQGDSFEGVAGSAELAEDALYDYVDSAFDTERAQIDLIDAVSNIGKSMAENGRVFDQYSEGGRANIGALLNAFTAANKVAGDDTALFASLVHNIIQQVVAAGGEGVLQVAAVQDALARLVGSAKGDAFAQMLLSGAVGSGMSQGFQKAGRSAGGAAKRVRTLLDYVKDLSGVMRNAFDFRFGFEQSTDDTLETFRSIEEAFARAREEVDDLTRSIQEYQAKISGLESDKSILEYFLTIAEEYDDELRVQAIRAELEKVNADLADSQADLTKTQTKLTKAQQKATPTLTGTTEAAVEQRKAVLDLVSSYQDQIEAYAATGASQAEIVAYTMRVKAAFEDQMRTLGYSQTEIKKYSVAFDDFRKVVERVPRNLTLTVEADPALRALDEYNAKLKTIQGTVAGGGFAPAFNAEAYRKAAKALALQAEIATITANMNATASNPGIPAGSKYHSLAAMQNRINSLYALLASGAYQSGGYTGPGPVNQVAGVVHRGEYVIPKKDVNQRTGLPYPDALARLARGVPSPAGYRNGGFVSGVGVGGTIDLSAMTLQQLQQMFKVNIFLDGKKVADNTSHQYALATRRGSN